MTPLTVAFRGNFQPRTLPAEDRWSTEHQVALTLEAMGHTVVRLQEDQVEWSTVEWAALRSDLFLWIQTWDLDQPGAFKTLASLRAAGVPSAAMHLDLFWDLAARRPGWIDEPYWRVDHVFTADGGHDGKWADAGVNHHWMPPAVFGPDCYRGEPDELYEQFPIVFVGSFPYPHAEWAMQRRMLINGVGAHYRGRFRVYNGGLRGRDLNRLYASAKIVIGDSCLAGQVPRFWSDRIPVTVGRGGFLLHPYVEGIEDWYVDGEHLRLFESGDLGQVCSLIDHYLACPDEASEIANRGMDLVKSRDTFEHRLRVVLDTVMGPQRVTPAVGALQA